MRKQQSIGLGTQMSKAEIEEVLKKQGEAATSDQVRSLKETKRSGDE
jgi:hypothetical protein